MYKTSAEYKLLRMLSLDDVHSCTPCQLKNHEHAFGLVLPERTYYFQPSSAAEQQSWVGAIHRALEAKTLPPTPHTLTAPHGHSPSSAVTTSGGVGPIPIPRSHDRSNSHSQAGMMLGLSSSAQQTPGLTSPSPTGRTLHFQTASSDSEDGTTAAAASVGLVRTPSSSPHHHPHTNVLGSPTRLQQAAAAAALDPTKTVLTGYLMKCGSKRKAWRKRWFVLSGEKLWYSANHMVSSFICTICSLLSLFLACLHAIVCQAK
jgi:pleckstrin homology domain-containing family A member 1/2